MIPLIIIALLYFSTSAETFKISTFALRLYVFSIHYMLLTHPFVLIFFSSITFYCTLFSTTLYIVFCIGKISYTFYQELHWFMARTFNSKYQKKKPKKKQTKYKWTLLRTIITTFIYMSISAGTKFGVRKE